MMTKCPSCKNKVELLDSDDTVPCDTCGTHYLDICPKCKAKFDFYGPNAVNVFYNGKWCSHSEDELEGAE